MSIPAHSLSFPPVLKGICSLSHQLDQMGNRKERGQHKLSMVKHQKKKKNGARFFITEVQDLFAEKNRT